MATDTTHDDNATTWRDLADQLTPAQIEHATSFESVARSDPKEVAEYLLDDAREHARKNLNDQLMFGHLPVPAGATRLWHWEETDAESGDWDREFTGTSRNYGEALDVTISGLQHADGSIRRYANIYGRDTTAAEYTADDLRRIAALVTEAADEMDRLNG